MKKEVLVYFYIGILILGAIFTVYLFNLQLTGFAVFEQNTNATFAEGTYSNVEYNGSAIILMANQTSGTYTSKIFDANESVTWNNLSYTPQGSGITFEVRNSSVANFSDAVFTSVSDLNNLNLTGRYFQYKVSFSGYNSTNNTTNVTTFFSHSLSSVIVSSSLISVPVTTSVTLYKPSGTISSRTNVPIQFAVTGSNVQCWYNVKDSSGAEIIGNTTPASCANSSFDLAGDGDYVLTLYANGSSGFASQSSTFLVSTPAEKETEKETPPPEEPPPIETPQEPQVQSVTDLSLQGIETSTINPSDSKDFNLVVKNTGTEPVSGCNLSAAGDSSSWASIPDDSKNFNQGEEKSFAFTVSVPENTTEANYVFPITVQCTEISKSSEFTIQVIKKRFEFNLTEVQRTRGDRVRVTYSLEELLNEEQTVQLKFLLFNAANQQVANVSQNQTLSPGESNEFRTNIPINESLEGNLTLNVNLNSKTYSSSVREPITLGAPVGGFAIFGEGGLGTGGVAVVLVVVVVLVVIFFVVRKMKRSGKILRSLFADEKKD